MKLSISYIIRRVAMPMAIGAFPTIVYHFSLWHWQWWAIAMPTLIVWNLLDATLVETVIEAWKERPRG